MKDTFVTDRFTLDLSNLKISYVEQNPRFKDSFFTKYSFPFSFYMDSDLRLTIGNYTSLNTMNLAGKYEGWHIVEGKIHKGTLEILEVKGNLIEAQIDSGFEELPNFWKKLSQLPLNKGIAPITDIYQHAQEVIGKKYPEVAYNFPRVIYNKHNSSETGWEHFNQFINDRRNGVFVTNDESGEHKNRNIIHPMPYLLYVLKVGFADAGYELQGDILEDADFQQRVIYCLREDFASGVGDKTEIIIRNDEKESVDLEGIAYFKKEIPMSYIGKYQLYGELGISNGSVKISANDVQIHHDTAQNKHFSLSLHINFDNSVRDGILKIEVWTNPTRSIQFEGTLQKRLYIDNDRETFRIHNFNEINLQNSVPNISFGDLVTLIKNWKNYDLEIKGNQIFMNRISLKNNPLVDFRAFEVENPTRKFNHKRSFHLSFADLDNFPMSSVYIDPNEIKLNKLAQNQTTSLKINAYCLPVETYRAVTTASPKKDDDSVLGLIYYDGLYDGDNLAQNPAGLHLPEILNIWSDWFKMRMANSELRWSFIAKKNAIRHINIRDTLYAYGQKLWIKELTKNSIDERYYQIEIVAEVVK